VKKIIIIAACVLLILTGLTAAYYYYARNYLMRIVDELQNTKQVLAADVLSAIASFNGERLWYVTRDGRMFQLNLKTLQKEEFVFSEKTGVPTAVLWQESGSDLIFEQNIGGHVRYKYFRAKDNRFVQYPDNVRSPVILTGDDQIAYDWVTVSATSTRHILKIADIDTNNFQDIGVLFRDDYKLVAHPTKKELVMFSSHGFSPLVRVDLASGRFENIAPEGRYLSVKFSPDGNQLLIHSDSIWVYDMNTGQRKDLNVPAGAMLWDSGSRTVYVASSPQLWQIDLSTMEAKQSNVFSDRQIKDAFLHPFENTLFFIDEQSDLFQMTRLPAP